jgi:hypothetical protein
VTHNSYVVALGRFVEKHNLPIEDLHITGDSVRVSFRKNPDGARVRAKALGVKAEKRNRHDAIEYMNGSAVIPGTDVWAQVLGYRKVPGWVSSD